MNTTGAAASDWLEVVDYGQGLALLSYPDGPPRLKRRSFLYDNALGLLWYSWTGDTEPARGLANTLISLQNDDGSWGFSFDAEDDGFYDKDYIRSGTVAWVGYALWYYGDRTGDGDAVDAARRGADFLADQIIDADRPHGGLVGAGFGSHDSDSGEFTARRTIDVAITEHQFDAHMLFSVLMPDAAADLQHQIKSTLWLADEGRFALAAGPDGVDDRLALDAAGAWGALWLASVGDDHLARESLAFTTDHFGVEEDSLFGFRPYLSEVDGFVPDDYPALIFVEGSLSTALALGRLPNVSDDLDDPMLSRVIDTVVELSCRHQGAIPYASQDHRDFPAIGAAAPTLWFLFLDRELQANEEAPLFPPTEK